MFSDGNHPTGRWEKADTQLGRGRKQFSVLLRGFLLVLAVLPFSSFLWVVLLLPIHFLVVVLFPSFGWRGHSLLCFTVIRCVCARCNFLQEIKLKYLRSSEAMWSSLIVLGGANSAVPSFFGVVVLFPPPPPPLGGTDFLSPLVGGAAFTASFEWLCRTFIYWKHRQT